MELGILVGFGSGLLFIILSILLNADMQISGLLSFLDAPSAMITLGGCVAGSIFAHPMPMFINSIKAFKKILKPEKIDAIESIKQIIEMANIARKDGLLALEEISNTTPDKFLAKGIMLIVDGSDPELVRNIMETELSYLEERHKSVASVWEFIASAGPAWGMLGTLIGLVMMLQNMSDPSSIGPSMAVAIITTFYGSLVANFIATPIATKFKIYSSEEILTKEILIEGILSIAAGENPRIIEEKLKVFLAPSSRDEVSDGGQVGE